MTVRSDLSACSRPKPEVIRWRHPFDIGHPDRPPITDTVCSECGWSLGLLEYEQGGNRMRWWRHAYPPVAIG